MTVNETVRQQVRERAKGERLFFNYSEWSHL